MSQLALRQSVHCRSAPIIQRRKSCRVWPSIRESDDGLGSTGLLRTSQTRTVALVVYCSSYVLSLPPIASSADPNTKHGYRAPIESRDRKGRLLALVLLSQNVQQRQVMLRRRDCEHRVRSEPLVVNERSVVAGENQLTRQLFEPNPPSRRVRPGGGPRNRCEGYAQGCRCRRSGCLHRADWIVAAQDRSGTKPASLRPG